MVLVSQRRTPFTLRLTCNTVLLLTQARRPAARGAHQPPAAAHVRRQQPVAASPAATDRRPAPAASPCPQLFMIDSWSRALASPPALHYASLAASFGAFGVPLWQAFWREAQHRVAFAAARGHSASTVRLDPWEPLSFIIPAMTAVRRGQQPALACCSLAALLAARVTTAAHCCEVAGPTPSPCALAPQVVQVWCQLRS